MSDAKFLTNQAVLPFYSVLVFPGRDRELPDAGNRRVTAVRHSPDERDERPGRNLAAAARASLSRLRNTGREDWFLDYEPDVDAAGPNADALTDTGAADTYADAHSLPALPNVNPSVA